MSRHVVNVTVVVEDQNELFVDRLAASLAAMSVQECGERFT